MVIIKSILGDRVDTGLGDLIQVIWVNFSSIGVKGLQYTTNHCDYCLAGKFGGQNVWRTYSFQAFGGKKVWRMTRPVKGL